MENLDRIRGLVFNYLREKYAFDLDHGNKYFSIEQSWSYQDNSELDFINKLGLRVSFYGKSKQSPIAYLFITASEDVFLIIQFSARSDYDSRVRDLLAGLKGFADREYTFRNKLITRSGMSTPDSINNVYEILPGHQIESKLDYFLIEIKESIDKIISTIINESQYSYLFFNRVQFEDYLEKEPNYRAASKPEKKNIRLKSLRVLDFRGINDTSILDLPSSARWIILTGENGFGKTSILQSIAAGLSGYYDENNLQLIPAAAYVGIEYYSNGEIIELNSNNSSRRELAEKKLLNELATYGSSRLEVSSIVTKDAVESQYPATYHLFNTNGVLLNVEQLMKDAKNSDKAFFDQLEALFKSLIPQLNRIEISYSIQSDVLYVEQDLDGIPLNNGISFSQLAAGFRSIIAMVGDLIYRLTTRQKISNFSELQGIVIIDELELHLHPSYQKLLPEILTKKFPNIQFIVSTHSPIPLLGIPKEAGVILLNVNRSQSSGVVIEKLDIDFSTLTPNAILTSPIFGFQDLIPESKSDADIIQSDDNYQDIESDQKLRKEINSFLSDERQKELLALLGK
ncbi:AAA family ATPase [Dyadobacter sp.]|uniref:AAA family ATPase n=1 Tax=Dyadobacter sp. TaxID=1914288 RepID=UPI003F719FCF